MPACWLNGEIAQAIGAALRDAQVSVDVLPVLEVRHPKLYNVLIVGSAI
jgi:menaquinone-dependent protoporphyrinogen IX oxidase